MTSHTTFFPQRYTREELYPVAYRAMYLTRAIDNRTSELFRKGLVKGTVINSRGNEATQIGIALPLRSGRDVVSLLHRDVGAHLILGMSPFRLFCQYMANAQSPTHGREGNVHHGDPARRRFPMISHLGDMLATVVGGVYSARCAGEDVLGLAVTGDGATSTGDFHESLNVASVRKVPVLFVIENNEYAYSTPTSLQYNCKQLSDRAAGYGISGATIDGTDIWEVYSSVCAAMDQMQATSLPYLLECRSLRLLGHAVYDQAEYVPKELHEAWMKREPLQRARTVLLSELDYGEERLESLEKELEAQAEEAMQQALRVGRPAADISTISVYAPAPMPRLEPFQAAQVKNGTAINLALDQILQRHPEAFVIGQDIGTYGSAFKTCKGLHSRYGSRRVMDMPICESATVGFCIGASQCGGRPIMEFQFGDFSTEAVTQLGLNAATWFFRSDTPAPLLIRMPCGGGITLGAFHSAELEGLWSRFPGLKIFYPCTPQETYEAILAAYYDPNPCIVLEHKALYWSRSGDIDFSGDLQESLKPRHYREGDQITVVSMGAMLDMVQRALEQQEFSVDLWNPYILQPLNLDPIIASVRRTGRLLVVQESTASAGLGTTIIARVCQQAFSDLRCAPRLISSPDMPVPFARELESMYLPDIATIHHAMASLTGGSL